MHDDEEDSLRINRLVYMTCVLDPKRRPEYLTMMLEEMYGRSKGKALADEVKKEMAAMFEVYKLRYTPPPSESEHTTQTTPPTVTAGDSTSDKSSIMGGAFEARFQQKRKEQLRGGGVEVPVLSWTPI
ncbi:unnamed protein product [Linum trigynum]|uniref:Uncharacterized protein n=1 Tax=Linum trigynum TaxID=586398 RepID=A0AAV2EW49_9ROSI